MVKIEPAVEPSAPDAEPDDVLPTYEQAPLLTYEEYIRKTT